MGDQDTERQEPLDGDVELAAEMRKPKFEEYPDSVKQQAMNYYVSDQYVNDEAIGRAVGAPGPLVARWRASGEPNGQDWNAVREAKRSGNWVMVPADANISAAEAAENILCLQQAMLTMAVEAMSIGTLVDQRGEPVEFLIEEKSGRKVAINSAMRPQTVSDVKRLTDAVMAIEKARDIQEERRMMQARMVADLEASMKVLWNEVGLTPEQKEQFAEAVQRLHNKGMLPDGALLQVQFKGMK